MVTLNAAKPRTARDSLAVTVRIISIVRSIIGRDVGWLAAQKIQALPKQCLIGDQLWFELGYCCKLITPLICTPGSFSRM
jgi:hypothetical protein